MSILLIVSRLDRLLRPVAVRVTGVKAYGQCPLRVSLPYVSPGIRTNLQEVRSLLSHLP